MTTNVPPMDSSIFDLFPEKRVTPDIGFIHDSAGTRTRRIFRGGAPDSPGVYKPAQRESWEWIPLLWSVATAGTSYAAVELGAGWGPWMTRCHALARKRGIADVHIYGVEAEPNHFEYLSQHVEDNNIPDTDRTLFQGLIAAETGVALFPLTKTPETSWGLRKVGKEARDPKTVLETAGAVPVEGRAGIYSLPKSPHEYELQSSISLSDLIEDQGMVNFMHVDIQGSEGDVLSEAIDLLDARFGVLAVGTHSHAIEDQLRALFSEHGWICHHDSEMHHDDRGMLRDGHQVWRNPRLAPTPGETSELA